MPYSGRRFRAGGLGAALWFGLTLPGLASELALSRQTAPPGASVIIPVSFSAQGSAVSSLQFDLGYDNAAMSVAVLVGQASRESGKRVYLAESGPGRKRFLILGLNQNAIPDGPLLTLLVNLRSTAASATQPVAFLTPEGVDPDGSPVAVSTVDGSITVQGAVTPGGHVQAGGVVNAASLVPGPVAPGEIITVIGSGIGPPAGVTGVHDNTSLLFDGIPAPVIYAQENQINAIVPYGVAGKSTTRLEVRYLFMKQAEVSVPVTQASPALFTVDSSGVGPGAILNQDSTLNTPFNPADRGSIVVLYATGAGQTNPAGIDGQIISAPLPKPLLPISVTIGGQDAEVLYQGAVQGQISGLIQINARVPPQVSPGASLPVSISAGPTKSPEGVTLAIR